MNGDVKKNVLRGLGLVLVVGVVYFIARSGTTPMAINNGEDGNVAKPLTAQDLPKLDPESVSRVITDPKTEKEYISNQLIVEFVVGVSEQESINIIEGVGGKMLQRFTAVPIFLIQVKDNGDGMGTASALLKLSGNAQVKKVELNYLTTLDKAGSN